jgi:hypothetical protein
MRITGIVASLAAVLVSTADPGWAQGDRVQWTGSVAQGQSVTVRGVLGSIQTTASDDGLVHVDARISDPSVARVEVYDHAEGVTICALYSSSQGDCRQSSREDHRESRDARVDFVVRVPAGVRFVGSTVTGDIDVRGLRSDVQAATVSGRLNIETTGLVSTATTVNGDVVLQLPMDLNAELRASTVSGTIESDFPITVTGPPGLPDGRRIGRRGGPHSVRATIGSGGPELRVSTVNGSIQLRRR